MAKTKVAPDPNVGRNIGALMEMSIGLGSQPSLARRTGVAQSTIGRIIRSEVRASGETLRKIADAYEVQLDVLYLDEAKFDELATARRLHEGHFANASDEPVERRRRVPLISWVRAGEMDEIQDDIYPPGFAEEWVDVYDTSPGDPSFALRVSGDSMTAPAGNTPTFPEGTIIIVDPTQGGNAGDFVVAKDVLTQQATFKKLTTDGGRWYLRPLNPSYPTIEIDDPSVRVIGKVIEFQIRGKL